MRKRAEAELAVYFEPLPPIPADVITWPDDDDEFKMAAHIINEQRE